MSKSIDLFKKLDTNTAKPKKAGLATGTFIFVIVLVLVVAALAAATAFLLMDRSNLDTQTASLQSYVEDPDLTALQAELGELAAQTAIDREFISLTEQAQGIKTAGLTFDRTTYQTILANMPSRVTLTDMAYAGKALTLNCITVDDMPPSDFAEKLDTCGYFSSVQYAGFTQSGEGQIVFTIVCS